MPVESVLEFSGGGQIPEANRAVVTGSGEDLTAGCEGDGVDAALVSLEWKFLLPSGSVPELNPVPRRDDRFSIWSEGHGTRASPRRTSKPAEFFPRFQVPDARRALAARNEPLAVGRQGD